MNAKIRSFLAVLVVVACMVGLSESLITNLPMPEGKRSREQASKVLRSYYTILYCRLLDDHLKKNDLSKVIFRFELSMKISQPNDPKAVKRHF